MEMMYARSRNKWKNACNDAVYVGMNQNNSTIAVIIAEMMHATSHSR